MNWDMKLQSALNTSLKFLDKLRESDRPYCVVLRTDGSYKFRHLADVQDGERIFESFNHKPRAKRRAKEMNLYGRVHES